MSETVEPLPDTLQSSMFREANKGLMVMYINQDLFNRAGLDVRKSIVFYDEHGVFEAATGVMPTADMLERLRAETPIRYWTKGI